MSWLGMCQVTKFRTCLSSDCYQKWKLLVSRGMFCGIDKFQETGCTCAPVQAPVCWMVSTQVSPQGVLGLGACEDVQKGRSSPEKTISKTSCLRRCDLFPSSPFFSQNIGAATAPTPINPFQVNQPQPLTLNQMRASPVMGTSPSFSAVPPISMEPIPLSSMAPVPVGMAPIPAMGTVASITRMGQGMNVSIAGSMTQPLHSTGIPPSASQSTNTTNPFLL